MAATDPTEKTSLRWNAANVGGHNHHHHHHLSIAGDVVDEETMSVRSRHGKKIAIAAACLGGVVYATTMYMRSGDANADGTDRPFVDRVDDSTSTTTTTTTTSVAFLGNSMFYFNDFPRFFEGIGDGFIVQNSCLHGGASIGSLILEGNAMYPQFMTNNAILGEDDDGNTVYDFGACTIPQLLLGRDDRLNDPGYPTPSADERNNTNPCRADAAYREYTMRKFNEGDGIVSTKGGGGEGWDYVIINDNTRNPARRSTRAHALSMLERFYVPWLLDTGSIPVFLWTHAYTPDYACEGGAASSDSASGNKSPPDMTGLEDVANFTSLTHVGYRAYVDLLNLYLPPSQAPRIAPVGLAYLVVHEEEYELWRTLFHCDNLHASPSGSFLQGCIVHYTLFGKMPDRSVMLSGDISHLWKNARMMQHAWEPPNPFPDRDAAEYLYRVAERVMVEGYVPSSYVDYRNGEFTLAVSSGSAFAADDDR
ncbi:hypothetical protein ACHAXA_009774 [Cyclostephanos tholiformis]|uniref:Uncharacterized protein n=1 Tax=Cyclostephanos tholiformis TaxID=382380 RepID=A0ABD3SGH0_9STRA